MCGGNRVLCDSRICSPLSPKTSSFPWVLANFLLIARWVFTFIPLIFCSSPTISMFHQERNLLCSQPSCRWLYSSFPSPNPKENAVFQPLTKAYSYISAIQVLTKANPASETIFLMPRRASLFLATSYNDQTWDFPTLHNSVCTLYQNSKPLRISILFPTSTLPSITCFHSFTYSALMEVAGNFLLSGSCQLKIWFLFLFPTVCFLFRLN